MNGAAASKGAVGVFHSFRPRSARGPRFTAGPLAPEGRKLWKTPTAPSSSSLDPRPHFLDAAAGDSGHFQPDPAVLHDVAHHRRAAQTFEHEPADTIHLFVLQIQIERPA